MMKMNAKKIGISIFLVIAVIIIAVVLINGPVSPLDITEETGPGGIALPLGFTEHKAPFLDLLPEMEGITMTTYVGSGTAEDALNVFKTSAIDAGWVSIEGEVEISAIGIPGAGIGGNIIGGAGFEKGDEILEIIVMQAEEQTTVMAWVMPKEVEEAREQEEIVLTKQQEQQEQQELNSQFIDACPLAHNFT